jgi:hypothetical protein
MSGDHLGLEQADGVARHRIAETGMEFLGHRRPANDIAALDDPHLHACTREVEGADKAVMATADDYGIIFLGHWKFRLITKPQALSLSSRRPPKVNGVSRFALWLLGALRQAQGYGEM